MPNFIKMLPVILEFNNADRRTFMSCISSKEHHKSVLVSEKTQDFLCLSYSVSNVTGHISLVLGVLTR